MKKITNISWYIIIQYFWCCYHQPNYYYYFQHHPLCPPFCTSLSILSSKPFWEFVLTSLHDAPLISFGAALSAGIVALEVVVWSKILHLLLLRHLLYLHHQIYIFLEQKILVLVLVGILLLLHLLLKVAQNTVLNHLLFHIYCM